VTDIQSGSVPQIMHRVPMQELPESEATSCTIPQEN
jgi:hypothetical protein